MALDPTTDIGKVRLRVGDFRDLPWLPDTVYQSTLDDTANNIPRSSAIIAGYILGMLTSETHTKLAQIESWDDKVFQNYKEFLLATLTNPTLMPYAPLAYGGGTAETNPLIQFWKDWQGNYYQGTVDQALHDSAISGRNPYSIW